MTRAFRRQFSETKLGPQLSEVFLHLQLVEISGASKVRTEGSTALEDHVHEVVVSTDRL